MAEVVKTKARSPTEKKHGGKAGAGGKVKHQHAAPPTEPLLDPRRMLERDSEAASEARIAANRTMAMKI